MKNCKNESTGVYLFVIALGMIVGALIISSLASGCSEALPAEGWYYGECGECEADLDEALEELHARSSNAPPVEAPDTAEASWKDQFYQASWNLSLCRDDRNAWVAEVDRLNNLLSAYQEVFGDLK